MSVCLLVIDDGREDYLARCQASMAKSLPPFPDHLRLTVYDHGYSFGFAGSIQRGWAMAIQSGADHVLHVESDFVFHDQVPLDEMVALLDRFPHLAQVALKRQAWNEEELAAGGIVEAHPDDFTERSDGHAMWTEHRMFFSTNPSVYRTSLCKRGWPQAKHSEGKFTHQLLLDPDLRFAFWGGKFDPPRVEHIGAQRAGHGY